MLQKWSLKGMIYVLAVFFFAPQATRAQVAGEELTLQRALEYALQFNQAARKARLDRENGQYEVDEVKARALPQINGSGGLTYNPILQLSALPGELAGQPGQTLLVAFGQKWNANAGVNLSQNLFDKGVFTGLKAARTSAQYYDLQMQLTEDQVIEQVATLYYQILVQRQKIVIVDSNLKSTIRVQSIIKGQYDNGLAKKIDLDRTRVNLSNLQAQRQQLANAVAVAENQLKYAMGMPIQLSIQLPASDAALTLPAAALPAAELDISSRLEYKLLTQQAQILKYQQDAYKAEYYPSLSLSGNYSYQGMGNRFPIFKGAAQSVNWFDYASLGLTLKIPIFNGNATRARVRQADISIRKVNEDIALTSLSLNLDFENAKSEIKNNMLILKSQRENADLANEVYLNTQNNYNQGLASLTDLIDAENALTEAQNNYSTALLDYRVAEIQMLKSTGQLKTLLTP